MAGEVADQQAAAAFVALGEGLRIPHPTGPGGEKASCHKRQRCSGPGSGKTTTLSKRRKVDLNPARPRGGRHGCEADGSPEQTAGEGGQRWVEAHQVQALQLSLGRQQAIKGIPVSLLVATGVDAVAQLHGERLEALLLQE